MKRRSSILFILMGLIATAGCHKNSGDDSPADKPAPGAAILIAPASNSACLYGLAGPDNKQTLVLQWNAATGAASYTVVVNNLQSGQKISNTASSNSFEISLPGNQPYSWYVISRATGTSKTAQSETWKFFLAGTPSSNYAPFPATAVSPLPNSVIASGGVANVPVNFSWSADDIDQDIASYTFYLDNKDGTTKISDGLLDTTVTRTLAFHKTYYWKIVTADKAGNESQSPVFEFLLN